MFVALSKILKRVGKEGFVCYGGKLEVYSAVDRWPN